MRCSAPAALAALALFAGHNVAGQQVGAKDKKSCYNVSRDNDDGLIPCTRKDRYSDKWTCGPYGATVDFQQSNNAHTNAGRWDVTFRFGCVNDKNTVRRIFCQGHATTMVPVFCPDYEYTVGYYRTAVAA
ncbi:hypothetical protein E4U53_004931 [Claviceps sorghi]|nr:hypothetical protein E4U53_004931 [Claviceps sorghi]